MNDFPSVLRAERARRKLTQAEFARHIGVSPATVIKYEAGTSEPSFSTAIAIADALMIPLDQLAGRQ